MNYRNVFRALSVKNAYSVLREIYEGCLVNDYRSFEDLKECLKMNKSTLRRITNRLSACGIIESVRDNTIKDGRKRAFIISDQELIEKISDIIEYMTR